MSKRTDIHRPGAIVPADYSYYLAYSGASADEPAWNMDAMIRVTSEARNAGKEIIGACGKCGVCGACYRHGALFVHTPTGDIVHMGHDCADKYECLMDLSAFQLERKRRDKAKATALIKTKNEKERAAFLAKFPGLEEALTIDHRIIADVAQRFTQYRTLSEKQVAMVIRIADEVRNPKPVEPADVNIKAPEGKRIDFEGVIVSAKVMDSDYGSQVKITVKVKTEAGTWLALGTCPALVLDQGQHWNRPEGFAFYKGQRISLRATLKPGREPHFAVMSRPSGRLLDVTIPQKSTEQTDLPIDSKGE